MELFQDLLFKLEDEDHISGYTEAIAWDQDEESTAEVSHDDQPDEHFQSPDLTVADILEWLTMGKH